MNSFTSIFRAFYLDCKNTPYTVQLSMTAFACYYLSLSLLGIYWKLRKETIFFVQVSMKRE